MCHRHFVIWIGTSNSKLIWEDNIKMLFIVNHNEELNDLYSLPNIVRAVKSRRMRWAGHVACIGEERGMHRVLVGKPEGKRPLGWPRRRWEDNIKMDLQEVGGCHGDWMELVQGREYNKGLSGSIKMRLISWLAAKTGQLLKRDSAPWSKYL
jgi:hypothetical protein